MGKEGAIVEPAYLSSILSHMSQGLLCMDLKGFVTTYNAAAESLLGIDSQKVLYKPFSSAFSDNLFGFSMREALLNQKAPSKTIATISSAQSERREVEVEATFMHKQSPGMIVLLRDITDWHRLQELAQRNDRLKALGELAAMVAHEIRNPLGSIKGFASLLEKDLKGQPDLQRLASSIVEGADNLNCLVTNVLNYSRPLFTCIDSKDLITLVHEVCRQVEVDEMFTPNIRMEIQSPLATLVAPVDVSLLKSALLNLIVNAIQAMPNGGILSLSLNQDEKFAIMTIADTGMGIPKEHLTKIFSPFFTTKATGNGFGLAEVHRVIQAHAGHIEVHSIEGKGTTFTISIPLKAYVN